MLAYVTVSKSLASRIEKVRLQATHTHSEVETQLAKEDNWQKEQKMPNKLPGASGGHSLCGTGNRIVE